MMPNFPKVCPIALGKGVVHCCAMYPITSYPNYSNLGQRFFLIFHRTCWVESVRKKRLLFCHRFYLLPLLVFFMWLVFYKIKWTSKDFYRKSIKRLFSMNILYLRYMYNMVDVLFSWYKKTVSFVNIWNFVMSGEFVSILKCIFYLPVTLWL